MDIDGIACQGLIDTFPLKICFPFGYVYQLLLKTFTSRRLEDSAQVVHQIVAVLHAVQSNGGLIHIHDLDQRGAFCDHFRMTPEVGLKICYPLPAQRVQPLLDQRKIFLQIEIGESSNRPR